jgi:hypothetical protein
LRQRFLYHKKHHCQPPLAVVFTAIRKFRVP